MLTEGRQRRGRYHAVRQAVADGGSGDREGPAADGRQFHGRHQQTIGPSRAEGTSTRQIMFPCFAVQQLEPNCVAHTIHCVLMCCDAEEKTVSTAYLITDNILLSYWGISPATGSLGRRTALQQGRCCPKCAGDDVDDVGTGNNVSRLRVLL